MPPHAEPTAAAAGRPVPHVLVTRPQPQADDWVARLQALGLSATAVPLLGIAAPHDAAPVRAAWQALRGAQGQQGGQGGQGHEALALVMFVSPSAVDRFFAMRPGATAWPPQLIAAGTGPGTRAALLGAGVPEAAIRTPAERDGRFDSEALWSLLQRQQDWRGCHALIVRGEGGRDWLAETLRQHGAHVRFVEAYRRTMPMLGGAALAAVQAALAAPAAHCWLFSSSEAVGHLPTLAKGADWSRARALATHPRIVERVLQLGILQVQLVAPSPEAVAALLHAAAPA